MRYLFLFLFLHCNISYAKDVAVVPPGDYEMNQALFTYDKKVPESQQSFWKILDKLLRRERSKLRVSNLGELRTRSSTKKALRRTSFFICNNEPQWACGNWKQLFKRIPLNRRVLILWEPPVVIPWQYTEETFAQFGKVLTWDDGLVDNKKFFKFQYPTLQPMISDRPSFSEKRLLCQMSGHKSANGHFDSELYTERHRAIHYFEQYPEIEFDFFGPGWGNEHYRNYKGTPPDTIGTLKKYKFRLCFENMKNIQGYITEKIFHTFQAGCVPVYWGASNISKHIPENCFIAFDPNEGYDALIRKLKSMPENVYNQYIANIDAFLKSAKAQEFSQKGVALQIKNALFPKKRHTRKRQKE